LLAIRISPPVMLTLSAPTVVSTSISNNRLAGIFG
jgi:hypothetical protein